MADLHTPIPSDTKLVEPNGFVSRAWNQFLYQIFGSIFRKIKSLEERVSELEP